MPTTFIYVLKDPETDTVRYVGKSDRPKSRLTQHFRKDEKCHRANWIQYLLARGLKPVLEIVDEVPEEHWQQWEVAYIEFFREQGCPLTNSSAGGAGMLNSTPEIRKKQSVRMTGEKNPCFGRTGKKSPMFGMSREKHPSFGSKNSRASSVFHGVCRYRITNKWKAQIAVGGKKKHLGYFADEVEAAEVYDIAAKLHHGAHAVLNFPD